MINQKMKNKIRKNVRNMVVISNLEREEIMKTKNIKKRLSIVAILVVLLSSSFITVNAVADGKLANDIKEKVNNIITVKLNGKELNGKVTENDDGTVNIDFDDKARLKYSNTDEEASTFEIELDENDVNSDIPRNYEIEIEEGNLDK